MPAILRYFLRLGPTNPIAVRLVHNGSRRTKHMYIRSAYLAVLIVVLLWSLLFATSDGNRGTYVRITRPKKLKLTWDDGDAALASSIELQLTPRGEKTAFLLNHDRIPTRAMADGLRAAWAGAVERLKQLMES